MRKLLLILLAVFVFSTSVFASELNSPSIIGNTYFDDLFNSANYTREFTVLPTEGKNLNIYVYNNGSNPIEVNIGIGGISITGYPKIIQPGQSITYSSASIMYEASWTLIINDRTGAKISGQVRARQFD